MTYETCLEQAKRALAVADARLQDEIATYPTPVSGCDVQYTHLLAERRRVRNAISALEASVFLATPRVLHAASRVESR